jgi:DNA-damage-inducible protein J
MSKSAVIQTRIDPELKNKAQIIFNKLNISMSEAISIFLTQVTLKRGIPFEITLPNELTADTLKKSEDGRDLHKVSSVNQLFKELDR